MTWRIHSWSPGSGTGTVASPHFGPWPFGPAENKGGKRDFTVGERVLVELDGPKDALVVRSVIPACQPQPEGTECTALRELNAAHPPDMHVEERSEGALRFWLGDCCERCADAWRVTFIHPRVDGLNDETDLDHPLLRLASAQECAERSLSVPAGSTAYCIVTNHGDGPDGPRVFVVADGIDVELRPRGMR
ncbi:MAG: hypothetical protein HOV81_30625 [Kofleriaceae bacterium]|nr:hypothetical protein [Kofleriaceae bacterium]